MAMFVIFYIVGCYVAFQQLKRNVINGGYVLDLWDKVFAVLFCCGSWWVALLLFKDSRENIEND